MAKYRLGDIAPVKQGIVPDSDQYWLLNLDAVESNTGNILEYVYVDYSQIGASTVSFNQQNVLYSKLRPYLNKVVLPDRAGYATSEMLPLMPNEKVITREYLTFFLRSSHFVEYINRKTSGAKMPRANTADLKAVEMECPPINEQNRIVSQINSILTIIAHRKNELSRLDELIRARFVETFGDPITNPKGWDRYLLNDCLERIDSGKSFVCSDKPRVGNYPAVLKLSAATYGDYRPEENKALLDPNQFVEGAEVHSGDLLFTRKNTPELVGMAAYIQETPEKLMMPDLIFRLVTNDKMNPVFLWQLINCKEFRPIIQGISGGSAKSMSNISKERLGQINVICPPRQIQDQLVPFVHQVDKSKSVVQKSLDKMQLLFDSLMQQYFG